MALFPPTLHTASTLWLASYSKIRARFRDGDSRRGIRVSFSRWHTRDQTTNEVELEYGELLRTVQVKPGFARAFNHRIINGSVMLTNELGEFIFLDVSSFHRFLEGRIDPEETLYRDLSSRGFIKGTESIEERSLRYWRLKSFLRYGPTLHAFVLTERCNHGCQYCHSSVVGMDRTDTDMSMEVAERSVDFALQTTSPWLTIEFQGGEPTANWDVLTGTVAYALERNAVARKELSFSLVTNFSLMTEERMEWLIENRVQVCTSLDGPADLHNSIRIFQSGSSHAITTDWIRRFNQRYEEMGLDTTLYRIEALPTIARASLTRARDIVDEFVSLGCRAIFLRKLDPFGFAAVTREKLGYSMDEFLGFYREALDYIVELNLQGIEVMERHAAIMLSKMIADYEPNYLDLRTPGGAAIGQLGYHPSGDLYSSDEGRMVGAMGDDTFKIGNVFQDSYRDVYTSDTVRALVLASTNDGLPDCVSCVYKPYCGQQPEYNYKTQGSIFGRMRDSDWCRKHKGIFDDLANRLMVATPEEREILERWTIQRPQSHFVQPREAE